MNQDESKFEDEFGTILRDMARNPDTCPDNDRLIEWQEGELSADEVERVASHVKACAECWALATKLAQEPPPVDDISWTRARRALDQRAWPWRQRRAWSPGRVGLIAAGVAALAFALVWLQPSPPPEIAPLTRSAVPLTVFEPAGAVNQLEFRWQAMPIHHAYVVEIAREGQEVASLETFRPPLPADADLLDRLVAGTPYRWRVRAVDAAGRTLAESEWTEFQLRD